MPTPALSLVSSSRLASVSPAREGHEDLCTKILAANRQDEIALGVLGFSRIEAPLRRLQVRGTTRWALVEAIREASRAWVKETRGWTPEHPEREASLLAMKAVQAADAIYWEVALQWAPMGVREARLALSRLRVDAGDAEQWAYLGLYAAAVRFDPKKNVLFSTYSKWWVRAWCYRQAQPQSTIVHVPAPARTLAWQVRTLARKGPLPEPAEIAEMLHLSVEQVHDALRVLGAQQPWVSLDGPTTDLDSSTVRQVERMEIPDDLHAEVEGPDPMVRRAVQRALGELREREREIVSIRFGINQEGSPENTLAEVGLRYGLSRERIRQIEREAMTKLVALLGPAFGPEALRALIVPIVPAAEED
jgi:RNA polymerase sigma factor (sigma-70 family)